MMMARSSVVSTRSCEQIRHELRHIMEKRANSVIGGFILIDEVICIILISDRLRTDLLFDFR